MVFVWISAAATSFADHILDSRFGHHIREHGDRLSSLRTWEGHHRHTNQGLIQPNVPPSFHHENGENTSSAQLQPRSRPSRGLTHQTTW